MLGKKKFNTKAFKPNFNNPLTVVGSAFITAFTIIVGPMAIISHLSEPSDEEIQAAETQTEITTTTDNFVEYELLGPDSIRANGPLLTHEFHFSSGQIYAMRGETALPSIDFDDVNRQEWIDEVRLAGCSIAQEALDFPANSQTAPENLDYTQGIATRYMELNCE